MKQRKEDEELNTSEVRISQVYVFAIVGGSRALTLSVGADGEASADNDCRCMERILLLAMVRCQALLCRLHAVLYD